MGKKWTQETRDKVINIELKKIKNSFPFQYSNDCELKLNGEIDIIHKTGGNKYMVDIIDNNGYRYYCEYHHLMSAKELKYELNKFFKRNKYTKYNINNYLKINGISLKLIDDIACSGIAREKLNFVDEHGSNVIASWNQIQRYPEKYKSDYKDILKERQKIRSISKEDATIIIYRMQEKLNRPIDSRDFRIKQADGIGIRTVLKYWGEVWLMQKELGLTVTGKHSTKLSDDEIKYDLIKVCEKVYSNDKRKVITYKDICEHGIYNDSKPYSNYCKRHNTSLKLFLEDLGFKLQSSGTGMNHHFSDGEKVVSLYELEFSKFLRDIGLIYNKDYFRDVRYSSFDNKYNGKMNCDYFINYNGCSFYIELAGFLGNKIYQECYRKNVAIKSKSKEKYRLDLCEKENMFKRNNLDYYILLKDDMSIETYKSIFNKYKKVG